MLQKFENNLTLEFAGVQYNISQMISYHQSCQWSVPHTFLALEPTVLVAAIGTAAFVTGILSDKYGRKKVLVGKFKVKRDRMEWYLLFW